MHYDVGTHAAQKGIDLVICIGELSKETTKGVADGKGTVIHFDTKEGFFEKSKELLQKGDAVLVKASHGMAFAEIVDVLKG